MIEPTGSSAPRRRVRVWFGETAISGVLVPRDAADRHVEAMQRRFAGLRVTDDAPGDGQQSAEQLVRR